MSDERPLSPFNEENIDAQVSPLSGDIGGIGQERRSYSMPPNWEVNNSGRSFDPEQVVGGMQGWIDTMESKEAKAAYTAKVKNATMFANMLQITPGKAFEMHDQLVANVFPNESLSSETFWGRMDMVFRQKKNELEISMLRFNQLNGDSSENTDQQINLLKVNQPMKSELDRIMGSLGDDFKTIDKKIVEAIKGTPYMLASQLPMWISQARHGLEVGAAMSVGAGVAGGLGAPVTAVGGGIFGFIAGGARYEYMMEAGLAYDDMLTQAHEAGVKLDPKVVRQSAKISAALITAVDIASLALGGAAVLKGTTKALGAGIKQITKESTKKILRGMMVDMAKARGEEAIGEGIQEVIGGISQNLAFALNEEVGNGHIDGQTAGEIWDNATTAMLMASSTAMFASGAGASYTASRSIYVNKAAVKTEAKINETYEQLNSTPEEIKEGAVTEDEIAEDRKEGDIRQRKGFQFRERGIRAADSNEFWKNVVNRFYVQRPVGIGIKEKFRVGVDNTAGYAQKTSFLVTKKGEDTYMTAEVGDFETQSALFDESQMVVDQGDSRVAGVGVRPDSKLFQTPNAKQENQVKAKIFQGEFGLELDFENDYAPNSTQSKLAKQMQLELKEMAQEGSVQNIDSPPLTSFTKNSTF